MKTVNININWNDEKSIKIAEKTKARLENKGYSLVNTLAGINRSTLVYSKSKPIKLKGRMIACGETEF